MAQNVPQSARDQLLTNDWTGQQIPAKVGELLSGYDQPFRLIRAAAKAETPSDWGLDLTEGPELLLPHLAQAKMISRIARLRVMWDLQNGKPMEARDDLLATLTLARSISHDGTLISVLVQIAMEDILVSTVAENFYQFPPETLKQLEAGFEAAPARGTAAQAVATGEHSFLDWFVRKMQEAQKQHPGDDAAVMASIRATFQSVMASGDGGSQSDLTDKAIKAAGGTSDGMLKLFAGMAPMYERIAGILSLPRAEYEAQIGPFTTEIQNSPNPLLITFFPSVSKSREKEFVILAKLAMLRAAVEYKSAGEAGFNSVRDPLGNGPFVRERFVFKGVDRGFQLKSAEKDWHGFPDVMIFVEKAGDPFIVEGKHAGEAVPKPGGK